MTQRNHPTRVAGDTDAGAATAAAAVRSVSIDSAKQRDARGDPAILHCGTEFCRTRETNKMLGYSAEREQPLQVAD